MKGYRKKDATGRKVSAGKRPATNRQASITHLALPSIDGGSKNGYSPDPPNIADYARDAKTGVVIPVLLAEVGKASNLCGTLGEEGKCRVFEVVLESKELSVCPACARYVLRHLSSALGNTWAEDTYVGRMPLTNRSIWQKYQTSKAPSSCKRLLRSQLTTEESFATRTMEKLVGARRVRSLVGHRSVMLENKDWDLWSGPDTNTEDLHLIWFGRDEFV